MKKESYKKLKFVDLSFGNMSHLHSFSIWTCVKFCCHVKSLIITNLVALEQSRIAFVDSSVQDQDVQSDLRSILCSTFLHGMVETTLK